MTFPLAFLTEADVEAIVTSQLTSFGYGTAGNDPMPAFSPGPGGDLSAQLVSPDAVVFLTVGGGPGFASEQRFDRTFITVRVAGPQTDYDAARKLAMAVDRALTSFDSSGMIGQTYTLYITRTGGSPQLLSKDTAERYHFTASYVAEPETGA